MSTGKPDNEVDKSGPFVRKYLGLEPETDEGLFEAAAQIASEYAIDCTDAREWALETIDDQAEIQMTNIHKIREVYDEEIVQQYKQIQLEKYGHEGEYHDDYPVVVKIPQ